MLVAFRGRSQVSGKSLGRQHAVQCPICSGPLEEREVAPCFDCGDDPRELGELRRGEHRYHWYRVFGQRILLCDFCDADFASYFPTYFGLPPEIPPERFADCSLDPLEPLTDPQPTTDAYCPSCRRRLAFLVFLRAAREHNARLAHMVITTAFREPGTLVDGELQLQLRERFPGDASRGWVPAYRFDMVVGGQVVGLIELRLGATPAMVSFGGQVAYGVEPAHRGHHFAARSLRLLLPLARAHRMTELWITCNPDNWASRRTCELAGADLVETVDLLPDSDMYLEGERRKCRYRITLSAGV